MLLPADRRVGLVNLEIFFKTKIVASALFDEKRLWLANLARPLSKFVFKSYHHDSDDVSLSWTLIIVGQVTVGKICVLLSTNVRYRLRGDLIG